MRPGRASAVPRRVEPVEAVTRDEAVAAARGCDVVLNALNPGITEWRKNALSLAYGAIAAAEGNGATLLFPGSVWNYGRGMPPLLDETTPAAHHAQGRDARRDRAAHPGGMRPRHARDHPSGRRFLRRRQRLLVRSGDRQGDRARRLTYPGPLDVVHAWAYLPDFAATLVRLAKQRAEFAPYETFGFPGDAVTGPS